MHVILIEQQAVLDDGAVQNVYVWVHHPHLARALYSFALQMLACAVGVGHVKVSYVNKLMYSTVLVRVQVVGPVPCQSQW